MPFPAQFVQTPAGFGGQTLTDWISALGRLTGPAEAEARVVARDQPSADLIEAQRAGTMMSPEARETHPMLTGQFSPLLRAIFQAVLQTAQDRPETVTVRYPPEGLPGGAAGTYNKQTQEIELNPTRITTPTGGRYENLPPTSQPAQETLTHELLHFLNQQIGMELQKGKQASFPDLMQMSALRRLLTAVPANSDVQDALGSQQSQHNFIQYLLGASQRPTSLEEMAKTRPLQEKPLMNESMRMVYNAVIQAIFQNPELQRQIMLKR
jgi:hypothetical protein